MPDLVVQGVLIAIIVASLAATWSSLAHCGRSWRWRIRAWRFVALRSLEEKQAHGRLALRRVAVPRALGGRHGPVGRGIDRDGRGRCS